MESRLGAITAGLAGCLVLAAVGPASAQECTGADATELANGCSVLVDNEDFLVRLYARTRTDLSTAPHVLNALRRTVVFVHGYGVDDTWPPPAFFEDGTEGVFDAWLAQGINVLAMAPGSSGADRVEDDAAALRRALELVDAYRGEAMFPLVVVGHSMGGLISRIALAGMEADGVEHGVALYVSYDAPHSGVNVPQGMQNLKVKLDEWAAMTEADFIAIDPGWEGVFDLASFLGIATSLDPDTIQGVPNPISIQAQEMTIQSVMGPAEHTAFMALLDDVGFPAVRSIAISNGNTQGIPNTQTVSPGGSLFYFTGAKGNSAASIRGSFEVFTDSPGARCFESHVYYDGLLQNHDGGWKNADTPEDIVLMDSLSGGTLDYAGAMLAAAEARRSDFHEPSYRGAEDSPIPFVPTWSALALPVSTADADIAGIVAAGGTPFDDVIAIGDLPAYLGNIDHNTIVLPSAVLDEVDALMTCALALPGRESDVDDDGVDDACDDDDDDDGVLDDADNCPSIANDTQVDADGDHLGDACDGDVDGDGVEDAADNCPMTANADQADADEDGVGDLCDPTDDPSMPPTMAGCACSALGAVSTVPLGLVVWMVAVGLLGVRGRRLRSGARRRSRSPS